MSFPISVSSTDARVAASHGHYASSLTHIQPAFGATRNMTMTTLESFDFDYLVIGAGSGGPLIASDERTSLLVPATRVLKEPVRVDC